MFKLADTFTKGCCAGYMMGTRFLPSSHKAFSARAAKSVLRSLVRNTTSDSSLALGRPHRNRQGN